MITLWDIYWITRLDGACLFLTFGAVISPIAALMCMLFGELEEGSVWHFRKSIITLISLVVVFSLLRVFLPSTKEAVAIYMVPKIVNNEQVQKLPDNAMKFLNTKLESWISEMGEKQKK
jgi:hypothetical protein